MGIETGLMLAGGLVGSYIKSKGEQNAAQSAANTINAAGAQSAQTQMDMYNQGQQATQGYRDRGDWAGDQYQSMLTTQGQSDFADEYANSSMFGMYQDQAEDAALRNASATGGMRTGQANVALASIAPSLIQQEYENRMGGFNTLQGYGSNAASQTASLATGVGQNVGQTQYNAATTAAGQQMNADTAMTGFMGDAIGTIAGVGADYFRPTGTYNNGQSYGR